MNAVRENLTEVLEGGQLPFREALTREWPRSGRDNRLGPDMTCPSPTDQKKRVPLWDEEAPSMIKVRSCQCPLMKPRHKNGCSRAAQGPRTLGPALTIIRLGEEEAL
jgi:hypothetical protein